MKYRLFEEVVELNKTGILPKDGSKEPHKEKQIKRYERIMKTTIGHRHVEGYSFDNGWETVSGDWTFQLGYDDKRMAERKFTVYQTH